MRRRLPPSLLAFSVTLLLATSLGARRPADAEEGEGVVVPVGLSADEDAAGRWALAALRLLAFAPDGSQPAADGADASGFLVSSDGLLVTTWRYLARFASAPGQPRLWARAVGGTWEPAVPVGRSWWADVGLVRLPGGAKGSKPLTFGASPRAPAGRYLTAGPGPQGRPAIRVAALTLIDWFDPTATGGRAEVKRTGAGKTFGKGAFPRMLRFTEELAGRAVEGAPVVDALGSCVGLVTAVDAERPAAETVVARPSDLVAPLVRSIDLAGRFDPLDLGVRLDPLPEPPGAQSALPVDLERLRTTTRERGGLVVATVDEKGPAVGVLWPGDLVLEIEGQPVFAEVYESQAAAMLALHEGAPTDLVLWRGKRQRVQVVPTRASNLYKDVAAEFEARGARLAPR